MKNIIKILLSVIFIFALNTPVAGTTYYIAQNSGDDSYPGTSPDSAWATIAKANNTLQAGDTVYIAPGVYDESIDPANSGSSGNSISYIADPEGGVIIRQALLLYNNYIRIIGFEITHNSTTFTHAITLYAYNYCEILHNNIHHIHGQAIRNNTYYPNANHNIIRGNTISYMGCPETGDSLDYSGANAIALNGSYNLIEYNDISHTLDFIDINGEYNIIRNNYTHDFANSDFPGGPGDAAHVDFWQPFSLPNNLTRRNIVENNFAIDIHERNSHFFQVRDELLLGIDELIIRGNLGARFGSYVAGFGAADHTRLYNNTFVDFAYNQTKPWNTVGYSVEPPHTDTDPSVNNHNFNNIYYNVCRTDGYIIWVDSGCSVNSSNNAAELSGSHPSCIVTSGIDFNNYANDDFHLQSTSNARNNGKAMTTITSASGTGSSFVVEDAGFFSWGFGLVRGDSIRVGASNLVRIDSIDYTTNTVLLNSPISWTNGDPVVLAYQTTTPTIGAYEYKSDYSYEIELEHPSIISPGVVQLTADITNTDNVRFVEFHIDGVPFSRVNSSPYTCTWNSCDSGKTYVITAKAYALFAETQPIKSSTLYYSYGDSGIPTYIDLQPNYPNPFNITTTINYSTTQAGNIKLTIYDILGREIKVLVDEFQTAGPQSAKWDGTDKKGKRVPSGTYFYQISGEDGNTSAKKMILLK